MKQLAIEGDQSFALGSSQVTLKIGRIANNRDNGVSEALCIRLYALESSSATALRGHVIAEAILPPLSAGSEKLGFEATVPAQNIPNGYFYPALTLAERSLSSPNGWAIFDICRFDNPIFFGKHVTLNDASFEVSCSTIKVSIGKIRNETQELTGQLRVTFLLTKEPYDGGPVKGLKVGETELEALSSDQAHERLEWTFDTSQIASEYKFALLFLEEKADRGWTVWDQSVSPIDFVPITSEMSSQIDTDDDPMNELDAMIGLSSVKQQMHEWKHLMDLYRDRRRLGLKTDETQTMHMCFTGNPGTGKTTVARIVGRLLVKLGLLQNNNFQEVKRDNLVGQYLGETALKTNKAIHDALGGVLFIDEAYSLVPVGKEDIYGSESIATLVPALENYRDKLSVIVAGYTADMKRFMNSNPGLPERICTTIEFPDYTEDELWDIFKHIVAKNEYTFDPDIEPKFKAYMSHLKSTLEPGQFGNARSVRNTFEKARQKFASRREGLPNLTKEDVSLLKACDFEFFDQKISRSDNHGLLNNKESKEKDLFQQLVSRFENEVAQGKVDPERVSNLRTALAEFNRRCLEAVTPPQAGAVRMDQLQDEIHTLIEQVGTTRGITHILVETTKNPSYGLPRPPSGSRAELLRELFWPSRRAILETHLAGGLQCVDNSEVLELTKQTSELDRQLHIIGAGDNEALELEISRLRALAERVRNFTVRKHLLLARPIWGNPQVAWSANTVFFTGRSEIRALLAESCVELRMVLTSPPTSMESEAGNFFQIVHSNVCVFDMAAQPGPEQAAVAYSLGIAWAMGKPMVVLNESQMRLPFDVNVPAVLLCGGDIERRNTLKDAVMRACYQVQTSASDENLDTLINELEAQFGHLRNKAEIGQSLAIIQAQHDRPDWSVVATITQQLIRFSREEDTIMLFHPRFPVTKRPTSEKRLFHIMPFSCTWSNDIMEAASAACGTKVSYIRGDQVVDQKIINSIWDEICQASHILVDLTGFNSNVALELGIAHCMGKPICVTAQHDNNFQLFSEIKALRIFPYKLNDLPTYMRIIEEFISG